MRSRSAAPSGSRGCRSAGSRSELRELLGAAQQLGEQAGVEGERLGPPLGQRRVALVEELADVAEQQRLREGGGGLRLHVHDPHPAGADVAHQLDQAGHVVDVLQHLAGGLQRDGEAGELAGHREQLCGALPFEPLPLRPLQFMPLRCWALRAALPLCSPPF